MGNVIALPHKKPKLLDQVRDEIRRRHYSRRTEEAYTHWIKRYILHHGKRHPEKMGKTELEDFLSFLAVRKKVAASTQNQAMNAILFLYREVLHIELDWLDSVVRAIRPKRLPIMPFVIPLQRTFFRTDTTSEPFKSSSATRTSQRP